MQNSVYNTVLLWRNGGEQDYCMCLAYICRQIPIKDKLEEWSAVSRNGYWAEQMSGLRGWLFTIYLFRASPLWNTHYFSHLLSMNYSSSFVSCLCDLFRGLVRKWWLMGRAWQVEYNGHYLGFTRGKAPISRARLLMYGDFDFSSRAKTPHAYCFLPTGL